MFEQDQTSRQQLARSTFPGVEESFFPQTAAYLSESPIHVTVSRTWQTRADVPKSRPVLLAETEYKRTVADRIRQARHNKGISQEALGIQIGKPRPQINGWENARGTPQWKNLVLIAAALDVTPQWLLTGHDDNGGPP